MSIEPPRTQTIRQSIIEELQKAKLTAREISAAVSIREKEVGVHLEHLERSLPHSGLRLVANPARCTVCDFVFRSRERLTRPSRCPACKSERIEPPCFSVEPFAQRGSSR